MNHVQIIRVAALLAVIFAAGVLTGRFTAPKPEVQFVVPGPRGVPPLPGWTLADMGLARISRHVTLTTEERLKLKRTLEEVQAEAMRYPAFSDDRFQVLLNSLPRIKEQLPPDKHAAIDRWGVEMKQRFDANRRQRPRGQR